MAVSNGHVENSSTATSNGLSSIEKEFTCAICHELFVRAHTLSCSHTFCEQCISNWLRKSKICPICRKEVVGKPVHSIVLDNAISKLVECLPKQPDNEAKAKSETVSPKEQCTTKTADDNHSRNALNSAPPSSSWSSWRNGEENHYDEDDDYDDEEDEGSYDDEEDDYDDYLQDDFSDNFHVEHHHYYYSNGHYEDEDGHYYDDDEDYSEEGSDDDDYDSEEEDDSEDETDESVDEYDNGPDYNGLPGYYWGKYGYCFKCGKCV